MVYIQKNEAASPLKNLVSFTTKYIKRFFKVAAPVIFNEVSWSVGVTIYMMVYANISTEAHAAITITETITRFWMVLFFGTGSAAAIMIGNAIGKNDFDEAQRDAKRILILTPLISLIFGLLLIPLAQSLPLLFKVKSIVHNYTTMILIMFAITLPFRVFNLHLVAGVLRGGGDTLFSMFLDILGVWVIGIPLAYISAFVFNLEVQYVYLIIATEEVVKFIIGIFRVKSNKWINDVTK